MRESDRIVGVHFGKKMSEAKRLGPRGRKLGVNSDKVRGHGQGGYLKIGAIVERDPDFLV